MGRETEERMLQDWKQQKGELKLIYRAAKAANHDNARGSVAQLNGRLDQFRKACAEALRRNVDNNPPSLRTDSLKNVKEFNIKLKQMIQEKEQLIPNEKSLLNEEEASVKRLEDRINMVKAALTESENHDRSADAQITDRHVAAVREKFNDLKAAMARTLDAHFGTHTVDTKMLLQELIKAKDSDVYVRITTANFQIMTFLADNNIVTVNPYNDGEVKIQF